MTFCEIWMPSIADDRDTDFAIMSIRFFSVFKYRFDSVNFAIYNYYTILSNQTRC